MTHLYGFVALAQAAASVYMYYFRLDLSKLLPSESLVYLTAFTVVQVAWSPVALSWLVHLIDITSPTLYAIYYLMVSLSVDGPMLGYFVIDYLYLKSFLSGNTFGPKPKPRL